MRWLKIVLVGLLLLIGAVAVAAVAVWVKLPEVAAALATKVAEMRASPICREAHVLTW